METKDNIFSELMEYLDAAVAAGFFIDDDIEEIDRLESEYWLQTF